MSIRKDPKNCVRNQPLDYTQMHIVLTISLGTQL